MLAPVLASLWVSIFLTPVHSVAAPLCRESFSRKYTYHTQTSQIAKSNLIEIELPESLQTDAFLEPKPHSLFFRLLKLFSVRESSRWIRNFAYSKKSLPDNTSSITDLLKEGQIYNIVVTSNRIFLASMDGTLLNNLMTKHYVVSSFADDVIFAGEIMKTAKGLTVINNNSGTYKPEKSKIDKAEEIIVSLGSDHRIFPRLAMPSRNLNLKLLTNSELQSSLEKLRTGFDLTELLRTLSSLEADPKDQDLRILKEQRKGLSLLRDLHYTFSPQGRPPLALSLVTHTMGQIADNFAAQRPRQVRFLSHLLRIYLGSRLTSQNQIVGSAIDLRSEYGLPRILAVEKSISKLLVSFNMTSHQFHRIRLNFKKSLAILTVKQQLRPLSQDEAEALNQLTRMNDELGAIHDRMVQEDLLGSRESKNVSYQMPDDLRSRLITLLRIMNWETP
jgi:hypothetical protein